jgi:glycosyltransferase involved in cell wall biosynthesis
MSLGVVIPCYRQETWLPRTIRALEAALAGVEWKGVLVMSEPGAAAPAAARGWTVIAPPVSRPLTPGASRMLGFAACDGTHVLFLDADVEVDGEWLHAALERAAAEPALAAVWGRIEEWFVDGGDERPGSPDLLKVGREEREVGFVTAVALYRRGALLAAGGYDPGLRSEEDFELGLRFSRLGLRMRSLAMRAGRHWSAPRPSFGELARRWRSGLCFGQGQVLRLYLGRPGFWTLMRRQGLYVATLTIWALGVVALGAAATGAGLVPLAVWAAAVTAAFGLLAIRKRGPRIALLSVLTWTLNGAGMLVGLLRGVERDLPRGFGRPA